MLAFQILVLILIQSKMISGNRQYLLLEYYRNTQEYLERVRKTHLQLRNFHHQPPVWILQYVFGYLAAEAMKNTTVICRGHPEYKPGQYPMMLPYIHIFGDSETTIPVYWNSHYHDRDHNVIKTQVRYRSKKNREVEMPEFVKMDSHDLNFAYCSVTRLKKDSTWDFGAFTEVFDHWIWLCIMMGLVLISVLSFSNLANAHDRGGGCVSPAFFLTLSVFLSPGVCRAKRSKLFVTWMFCSYVLVTLYTGNMASVVIRPPEPELMGKFEELLKHNYTLVFRDKVTEGTLKSIIVAMMKNPYFFNGKIKTLWKLFQRTVYRSNVNDSFVKTLAGSGSSSKEGNMALVMGWPFAMLAANDANNYIDEHFKQARRRKKCHIGKELISGGEIFFMFLPPDSERARRSFQFLVNAGIVKRWSDEWMGVACSSRVQDRLRFVSPTQIKEDEMYHASKVEALKLDGETITIFLVWIFCICGCVAWFLVEFVIEKILILRRKWLTRSKRKRRDPKILWVSVRGAVMIF